MTGIVIIKEFVSVIVIKEVKIYKLNVMNSKEESWRKNEIQK